MDDVGRLDHTAYTLVQPASISVRCNANDFSQLKQREYLLVKLSDNPYDEILRQVNRLLNEQITGSRLLNFCVSSHPRHQIHSINDDEFSGKRRIITHIGVEFEYQLSMMVDDKIQQQTGVFTWVGYHLNTQNKSTKAWLDINQSLGDFVFGTLSERMHLSLSNQ